ncbi:MAG: thiol peroxidase [Vulcanimicrobiaceae bacterium]
MPGKAKRMATYDVIERPGAVTFQGNPLTAVGPALAVGDHAPDFSLTNGEMGTTTLSELRAGGTKAVLLVVVPSLDTPVCALETETFHKRLRDVPASLCAALVSRDLPFAQKRWASATNATGLTYLSDYRERSFGPAYGVEVKELALLARSIFLIDKTGKLAYVEIVREIADQPDYDAVFDTVRNLDR